MICESVVNEKGISFGFFSILLLFFNSDIFGYVGDFSAQPQNDNSEPKEEIISHNKATPLVYENVTLKFDQESQSEHQGYYIPITISLSNFLFICGVSRSVFWTT